MYDLKKSVKQLRCLTYDFTDEYIDLSNLIVSSGPIAITVYLSIIGDGERLFWGFGRDRIGTLVSMARDNKTHKGEILLTL